MKLKVFQKKTKPKAVSGLNKKGTGFRLFKRNTKKQKNELAVLRKKITLLTTAAIIGAAFLLFLIGHYATPDFTIMVSALFALSGLVLYDILSRRLWEETVTEQIHALTDNHDRLIREVARNRSDVAILKEGLGGVARAVETEGRHMPPASSAEARMIETIVLQLGMMGDNPRAEIETKHDTKILELEMAPPPSRPLPVHDLDSEFNPDFSKLSNAAILDLIQHAVRHDGIDIFFQPVVSLPQRKPRMYEIFTRIRAGGGVHLEAARYLATAQKEHLIPAIDNLLLLRCLQKLRDQSHEENEAGVPYILNITGATLNDRGFMGDLVSFLTQYKHMASQLIFELPQEEIDRLDETVVPILEGLTTLGCRFSMDRIRQRKIDITALKTRHIRFIKLDSNWLMKESRTKSGFSRIIRLKKQLDAAGIDLIIEKIENEDDLRELLDYNIDFGQGYLFGKPDMHLYTMDKQAA